MQPSQAIHVCQIAGLNIIDTRNRSYWRNGWVSRWQTPKGLVYSGLPVDKQERECRAMTPMGRARFVVAHALRLEGGCPYTPGAEDARERAWVAE